MGFRSAHESYFPFLLLPLEIRLQIYDQIIQDHPAHHGNLSPACFHQPTTSRACCKEAISSSDDTDQATKGNSEPTPILSSSLIPLLRGHGCGRIPSALLRTCKQINIEARALPFLQNEFVFTNWFNSGIYAARAFTRALKPWQRTTMRYARLEVLRRDLENSWVLCMVGGRPGAGEWRDLCALWSGVEGEEMGRGGLWGLRLGLMGPIADGYVQKFVLDGSGGSIVDMLEIEEADSCMTKTKTAILNVNAPWVTEGLGQMKSLKLLEIEIEDERIPLDEKVQFCFDLERKLNGLAHAAQSSKDGCQPIHVMFVEKIAQEKIVDRALEVTMVAPQHSRQYNS